MRTSWLLGALVTFLIGFILTTTIIGALIGIPLILLSVLLLFLAFIIPEQKIIVHEKPKKKTKHKK